MQGEARRRLAARLRAAIVDAAQGATQFAPARREIDRGQRRRAIREINRITGRYGWQDEIQHALDQVGQPGLKHLDVDQLEILIAHLHRLVDCIQTASDPHDAPPAR